MPPAPTAWSIPEASRQSSLIPEPPTPSPWESTTRAWSLATTSQARAFSLVSPTKMANRRPYPSNRIPYSRLASAIPTRSLEFIPPNKKQYVCFLVAKGVHTKIVFPGSLSGTTSCDGVNQSGEVVGSYATETAYFAFTDVNGTYTSFQIPGAKYANIVTISNNGKHCRYLYRLQQQPTRVCLDQRAIHND
jgi:hypothetical protein